MDSSGIPKDAFEVAIDRKTNDLTALQKSKGIELTKDMEPGVFFMGFNMEDALFKNNKPLRQAMSMALNRQRFIDLMWNGRGVICKGPIAPEFPLYETTKENPNCDFNVAAAREKMREAIRIHGGPIPEIPLLFPGSETFYTQLGEIVKQDMEAIGIKVKPDYRTFARFQEMVDSRQAQFFDLGWQADYPDEQTFLLLFYGKNRSPGPNNSNYSNPKYDELYEKASVMQRSPERDQLYLQMIKIVQDDCPVIFSCARVAYALHYGWVSNMVPNEFAHGNRAHWYLDSAKRRQYASRK
jgi:ABC-type transport system substrate-binding protein